MIIKKIGTSQLGNPGDDPKRPGGKREDETTSLEALRNSLGAGNTLSRGNLLAARYEIEQVIGYGGMSTVYRARDTRFTHTVRVCAVKEMFDVSTDPTVRQDKFRRFEEEANYLALLNHIAIPKIYDFFAANDRSYLVEEFVEGKNLETLLEENAGPLDEQQVLGWGIQLCEVLAYLHNHKPKPIVFRDMKPSNVMMAGDDRLVLIDFGIAKTFQEDKKGTMIGTEGYSPPEQYKGLALPAGDIYALGATLHQLLTNSDPRVEVPFTFHERMPRSLNPMVSPEVEKVVMKALEFDMAKRWLTVEEFRDAMIKLTGRRVPGSSSGRASAPLTGSGTRNLGDINFDSASDNQTNSISAARSVGMTGVNPTAPRQPASAPAPHNNLVSRNKHSIPGEVESIVIPANLPMAEEIWTFTCEEEIRDAPVVSNGIVYVGCYDYNMYALDARSGGFLWKAATQGGICTTPCIADKLVVVGSEDNTLYAYESGKGQPIWNLRTGGPIRGSVRYYSPMLFFGSDDFHIYCVEARTGKLVWKTRTWAQVRSTPSIVSGIVYIGSDDGHLYALDGNTGNVKWRFRTLGNVGSSPVVVDNMAYVGSQDGQLYCIDTSTGWKLWAFKAKNDIRSSPTHYNGKIYFGSVDGHLYCLDAKKGTAIWKFDTGLQITSSPHVADGMVFFGGIDGNVYALDADKGTPRWYYPTEGPISSSPAVENGVVYIGSLDYHVYALSVH